MARTYQEITYAAPLAIPMETDAYIAPAAGEWRVVVFPGSPCNKLLYTRFLRTAPAGVEYVVLTRPGFGKGHEEAVTCFAEQVAAAKPFFDDGKNIVALGVSYGGELALKAALDFPDVVKGAVAVAALIDEPHDYALRLEAMGGEPGIAPFVPNRWQKVRAEISGRREQIGPLLERLKSFDAPVEIVHGDFDSIVPRSNSERLLEVLGPAARLDIVPGGTHYLELQYPRRLHRAVRRVIDRAVASATAVA